MTLQRPFRPIRDVLRNPAMVRLQVAWFLSIAAEWAYVVALLVFAYGFGGIAAAGLISTLRMLLPIVGAPIAATVADRLPANLVLAGALTSLAPSLVAASAAMLVLDGLSLIIFAAAMIESLLAVLKRPATFSMLPALARTPEELIAGNAVTSTGEALGVLIGPAVASLLLVSGGLEVALGAPAIALLVAAVLAGHDPGAASQASRDGSRPAARARRWLRRPSPPLRRRASSSASSRPRPSCAGS